MRRKKIDPELKYLDHFLLFFIQNRGRKISKHEEKKEQNLYSVTELLDMISAGELTELDLTMLLGD